MKKDIGTRILVTGATGFVGGHIAQALIDAGHKVKLSVRDINRARSHWPGADLIKSLI